MSDFESCGRAVLAQLQARFGYELWMITRTQGDRLIALQTHGTGVAAGDSSPWSESLCKRMVDGRLPNFAGDLKALGQPSSFAAYIGFPLRQACGDLFGTLCAFASQPQPALPKLDEQLVELQARLLTALLQQELSLTEVRRHAERVAQQAQTDALTGLLNRGAWDRLLEAEELRCRRYGHAAAVALIDLDGLKQVNDTAGHAAGDQLIASAAQALRAAARGADLVARLGGDEFGLLAVEYGEAPARLQERLRLALAKVGVQASIGVALRVPATGLALAQQFADAHMYEDKRARQALRAA